MTSPDYSAWPVHRRNRCLALFVLIGPLVPILESSHAADGFHGIPLKPDPPFAVDGNLDDWNSVPNAYNVRDTAQVVWGAAGWTGSEDASGTVKLSWRADHLFLAADVSDDRIRQSQRGGSLWKGDNVQLLLDVRPGVETARNSMGDGQFQLGFSPGNFEVTGDVLNRLGAEAAQFHPADRPFEGVQVASQRTPSGYSIEAAIPWSALGIESPTEGTRIAFEIALSDSDTQDDGPESLLSISTDPWEHTRSRLLAAVLAGADGAPKPSETALVFDAAVLTTGTEQRFTFDLNELPEGRQAVLTMMARLDYAQVAGYAPIMRVTLNDTTLGGDRLLNKPLRVKARGGDVYSMSAGDLLSTYYSPDFTSPDLDPHYGLLDGIEACRFELDATGIVRIGENVLVVANAATASVPNPLHVAKGALTFRDFPAKESEKTGPPTGPLPRIAPIGDYTVDYRVAELPDGKLSVEFNGERFDVASQYSTPNGEWVHGSNEFFQHERNIEKRMDSVVVRDTFTNRTNENLPLMHRAHVAIDERTRQVWLSGRLQSGLSGTATAPANPTTLLCTESTAVGLVALSDVFRVHVLNYAVDTAAGLADNSLVIPAGASHTAEWAIVPVPEPDYWRFLNVVRRLVGANFTIDGGFAFFRTGPLTSEWTDQQTVDFLRLKDVAYACASNDYPRYNGYYSHGTAFQRIAHDAYVSGFERRKRLAPAVKNLVYFHCFIDVIEDGPDLFPDSMLLGADGKQLDYGEPHDKIYIPTETNSFGPAIAKNVDVIFDTIGADGVYWDEHEYSRWSYHYGEPWDNCSGDIDSTTMQLRRLKSSVTLITEPWRLALAKRILARGPLIGNGAPHTRAMADLKFPCFVETGSITHCTFAHLYSPIALGDHLTERNERDAYGTMLAALDYGCVYHWYNDLTVIPTHHHLTRYMYPITPMELHEGYIIGEERIVTNRSGIYGWGDSSNHEVHVFNDEGIEVEGFEAPVLTESGNTYTELRIAEGWSAAIVRSVS